MATLAHTLNLDIAFFNELISKAYPAITDEQLDFTAQYVKDGVIQIESLFEHAISKVGNLDRCSENGKDFVDGSDAKKTTARFKGRNNTQRKDGSFGPRTYAAGIKDVHNKVGILRVMCYERIQNKFYYFKIPHAAYQHITPKGTIEIPFCQNGDPRLKSSANSKCNWWNFQVDSFEEMAN